MRRFVLFSQVGQPALFSLVYYVAFIKTIEVILAIAAKLCFTQTRSILFLVLGYHRYWRAGHKCRPFWSVIWGDLIYPKWPFKEGFFAES